MKVTGNWTGSAALVLAVRVVGALLSALVLVWLARQYPQAAVGQFGIIWAAWVLARVIGPLGYDQAALRFLSVNWADDQPTARSMAHWQMRRVRDANLWVAVVGVGLAATVSLWDLNYGLPFMVAALGHPLAATQGLMGAQARAIGRPVGPAAIEALAIPILIGVVSVLPRQFDVVAAGALPLLQLVVLGLVQLLYIWQHRVWREGSVRVEPTNVEEQQRLARTAMTAIAATALSTRGPIVLISAFAGLRGAALFEVSQRIQNLGAMPTSSVAVVVSPIFANLAGAGSHGALKRLAVKAGAVACVPALIFAILMILFGDRLLEIFGTGYEDVYWPSVLLLAAAAVNGFFGLSSNALLMSGMERVVRTAGLIQLGIVLLAVPIGVIAFGVAGGAAAVLGAVAVRDISLWTVLMRRND